MVGYIISFILGFFTNYIYDQWKKKYGTTAKEELPSILNNISNWSSKDGEIYYYSRDPKYKIKIGEMNDVLSERFKKFPDREHNYVCWVQVFYEDMSIFGWNFMCLDGRRIFIPLPKSEVDTNDQSYDYYDLNSQEIKIFQIIGESMLVNEKSKMEGLKNIARILNIEISNL